MYLAYFDESGDSGVTNSPTTHFVLSCVLVKDANWLASLDELVQTRRLLKQKYGIRTSQEIKATNLRRGHGPLAHLRLSPAKRMEIYRGLLKWISQRLPDLQIFAIAIEKSGSASRGNEPREAAWTYAIQRLNKFSGAGADEYTLVFPDEGHGFFIRKLMRKMRRFHKVPKRWGSGFFDFPTERVVEDPSDRRSHDSYFVQLADWAAFAALRSQYVAPSAGSAPDLWDQLDPVLLKKVNQVRGGPPGIVLYP